MVPIFLTDISKIEKKKKISFSPLKCYIKNKDNNTILTPCNQNTRIYKQPPTISDYLPSTEFVSREWRTKKPRAYNKRKPKHVLQEVPEIAETHVLNTNSTKRRLEINKEIEEAKNLQIWRDQTEDTLKQSREELLKIYEEGEINTIKTIMERIEKKK